MITKTTLRLAILNLLIAGLAIPAGAKMAKVFMASPAPCYSPEGNVVSYATNCIGDGAGCEVTDCPPGTTKK